MNDFGMKCFDENRELFGDTKRELEKWNLYNGLAGMAEDLAALQGMRRDVQALEVHLSQLSAQLQTVSQQLSGLK